MGSIFGSEVKVLNKCHVKMENKQLYNKPICKQHRLRCDYYCTSCQKIRCHLCYDSHMLISYRWQLHATSAKYFLLNLENPRFMHKWKGCTIAVIYPITKEYRSFTLEAYIDSNAESISYNTTIYFIGGYCTNNVIAFYINHNVAYSMNKMKQPRYFHTLCLQDYYIYSIGGYKDKELSSCEKYNIKTNKWADIPNLSTPKYSCAAFYFRKGYIYSVGGSSSIINAHLIERLVTRPGKEWAWENVTIDKSVNLRSFSRAMHVYGNKALIFGGTTETGERGSSCVMMDIKDNSVELASIRLLDGKTTDCKLQCCSAPVMINQVVYATDNEMHVNRYSLRSHKIREDDR